MEREFRNRPIRMKKGSERMTLRWKPSDGKNEVKNVIKVEVKEGERS